MAATGFIVSGEVFMEMPGDPIYAGSDYSLSIFCAVLFVWKLSASVVRSQPVSTSL